MFFRKLRNVPAYDGHFQSFLVKLAAFQPNATVLCLIILLDNYLYKFIIGKIIIDL